MIFFSISYILLLLSDIIMISVLQLRRRKWDYFEIIYLYYSFETYVVTHH